MEKSSLSENLFPYVTESRLRPVTTLNGKDYLYFAGTGYYQLQSNKEVVEAAVDAVRKYGISSATSRTINGSTPLILKLENRLAQFFQAEDAAYLPSGYLSNLAGFQALDALGVYDVIFIDELAHYSNMAGARATGKKVVRFRHLDEKDLEKKIEKKAGKGLRPLIVSDGLFPIWAEIPPVPAYLQLAEKYDGAVWVDDAHGAGILGENGRGVYEHFGLVSPRLFGGGTLSKAFGAYGGFVTGNAGFIQAVKTGDVMRGTNSPPAALAGAALRGLELVKNNPELRKRLRSNSLYLKEKIKGIGIETDQTDLPIVTFSYESAEKMQEIQKKLMEKGIYIQFVKYVGSGADGVLRMVVSSAHSKAEIDFLVSMLRKIL
ncbi:MAG TPA: pyridoxal phosphate-dependent aminotransferase family protein [Bacteroidetes bacterium]|nr:pyridoxal phosphate-dependent aminotransferase family protein [Bacteroidota bacterium]